MTRKSCVKVNFIHWLVLHHFGAKLACFAVICTKMVQNSLKLPNNAPKWCKTSRQPLSAIYLVQPKNLFLSQSGLQLKRLDCQR